VATVETVRGPVDVDELGSALMQAGVGEEQITRLTVDNPRRFFGG